MRAASRGLLVAWLFASGAIAESPRGVAVAAAAELFEVGKLAEAQVALEKALSDPALGEADRITARSYLAATRYGQRDARHARR